MNAFGHCSERRRHVHADNTADGRKLPKTRKSCSSLGALGGARFPPSTVLNDILGSVWHTDI